jgi:hypothetical protein
MDALCHSVDVRKVSIRGYGIGFGRLDSACNVAEVCKGFPGGEAEEGVDVGVGGSGVGFDVPSA